MPAPRGIVQWVDQNLHRRRLLAPGMRILVACSGGADSVALLRMLCAINGSDHWGWTLVVGHVNHGLRGAASDGDAAFVRKLAKSQKLKCEVKKIRMKGVSEGEARIKRLAALKVMMKKHKLSAMVTAHHQDDQAETVLLRLIRGCGVRGAAGMARRTRIDGMLVVRPLLDVAGGMLREYLKEIGQDWREDVSNASTKYRRNVLRHQVLPVLRTLNPDVAAGLSRFAELSRDSAKAIERDAKKVAVNRKRGVITIDRQALRRKAAAVRGIVLRQAIAEIGGRPDQIDYEQLRSLVRAVKEKKSGVMFVFGGGVAVRVLREVIEIGKHRR